eukprot:m.113273 g.113273  ORF g.113273 m.113273 type:complete len:67 (+) comp9418_c0_seq9:1322-1522(+)
MHLHSRTTISSMPFTFLQGRRKHMSNYRKHGEAQHLHDMENCSFNLACTKLASFFSSFTNNKQTNS